DHLRYNLLTAQYHLPSLITFAETADHLHRNPQGGVPVGAQEWGGGVSTPNYLERMA
ncbi:hypothetical protein ACUXG4_005404, partial [Cupriavidus metallidurans]